MYLFKKYFLGIYYVLLRLGDLVGMARNWGILFSLVGNREGKYMGKVILGEICGF